VIRAIALTEIFVTRAMAPTESDSFFVNDAGLFSEQSFACSQCGAAERNTLE
jgi:hypothetical protein